MSFHILTLPDAPAELPGWLEKYLLGPDLGALVAELSALHGPAADCAGSLQEVLGDDRAAMLAAGLGVLPRLALQQCLRQPQLLLDLQELILTEGGSYWSRNGQPAPELAAHVARGHERLQQSLLAGSRRLFSQRRWWLGGMAAAALLGMLFWHEPAGSQLPRSELLDRVEDGDRDVPDGDEICDEGDSLAPVPDGGIPLDVAAHELSVVGENRDQ